MKSDGTTGDNQLGLPELGEAASTPNSEQHTGRCDRTADSSEESWKTRPGPRASGRPGTKLL